MTEAERAACLARAGFNLLNLDPSEVDLDLLTDVPFRVFVREVRDAARAAGDVDGPEPVLDALAEGLYGPFRFVFTNKGRAAELALIRGLRLTGFAAVTHPLFRTTQKSLLAAAAKIELAPLAPDARGSADIDVDWLARRLGAGGVSVVYLEPGANAIGGWPLRLDNVEAVARCCRRHGALLLLDGARLLSNCLRFASSPFDLVRRFTSLCDAFTVSCSKEFLVPSGALLAVRDRDLQQRCHAHAFNEGALLEPYESRARLAAGFRYVSARPEVLADRARQVELLAGSLRASGVKTIEPAGAHAAYVAVPLEEAREPTRCRGVEGLLYRLTGIRARINHFPALGSSLIRLAVSVGRFADEDLRAAGPRVRLFLERIAEAPRLTEEAGEDVHDLHCRYRAVTA